MEEEVWVVEGILGWDGGNEIDGEKEEIEARSEVDGKEEIGSIGFGCRGMF